MRDVQRDDRAADGQILLLGVDDVELPTALRPAGYDVLLQADGSQHWIAVAAVPEDWAKLGAEMVRRLPKGTVSFRTPPGQDALADFVRGWRLAGYRYPDKPAEKVLLVPRIIHQPQVDATLAARALVNTPSSIKSPSWMVKKARKVAKAVDAEIDVLGVKELRAAGFGGVLAVGAGSATPPRVVIMRKPGRGPRIVVVGKGITFDSGGLSIKPREAMVLMKTDMAGAAAALSAVPLIPDGADVTILLGLAENAVGAKSYKPGDVIEHVGGMTSEVLNTDAEGRLVLADLLAFARMNLQPDVMVDLATLTGAATIALSRELGALYSTSPILADSLLEAGRDVGEPLWSMPLEQSYREALQSQIADQSHVSVSEVGAGSITAALFLQRFVGDLPWAHLDIAGPARATAAGGLRTYGGTGFGAALLGRWMEQGARF